MRTYVAAAIAAFFAVPVVAQPPVPAAPSLTAPIMAVARPSATGPGAMLPSNTEIWLSAAAEVSSKTIKQGDTFDMTVARDVMLGDYIVIPRGTRGSGRIGYRTGKGAFGKSAKMEFDIVDVELNGRTIPVSGHYRIEGQGNTGATVGTVVAAGVFAAFVTGHSAVVAPGTEYKALTTSAIPVAIASAAATPADAAPAAAPASAAMPH